MRRLLFGWIGLGVFLISWLSAAWVPIWSAQAAVLATPLPTRPAATPGLPPRATQVPTVTPSATAVSEGALIQLWAASAPDGVWTVVQWGDGHGRWYDVQGWRGTLDDPVLKTWWVAPADFGHTPFRWLVYDQEVGGRLLATSDPFGLPTATGQLVRVMVTIPPEEE